MPGTQCWKNMNRIANQRLIFQARKRNLSPISPITPISNCYLQNLKLWPTYSLTDWLPGRMSFLMELFNFQNNFPIFPTLSEPTCSCGNCFLPLPPCMPPSFLPEQNRNEGAFTVNNDNITRPSKIEIYHRDHWINTVPIWICFYWIYSFISIVLLDL